MIWIAKACLQKCLSYLPYKYNLNYFFQKKITGGVKLSQPWFDAKFEQGITHLKNYNQYNSEPLEYSIELGTGWYPVIPIIFYLNNVSHVFTIDIAALVNIANIKATIQYFESYYKQGKLAANLPQFNADKMEQLLQLANTNFDSKDFEQLTNITFWIGDINNFKYTTKAQIIHSNNTLEHIYPLDIIKTFNSLKQWQTDETIHSHQIDLTDHFAHLDKSISHFNFLKFSDKQWKWIDNSIQPQNRLRIYEYRALFEQLGYKILNEVDDSGDINALSKMKLAKRYKPHPISDLAITHSFITMVAAH